MVGHRTVRATSGRLNARRLVETMHGQRIVINAREGCIHMGVHFYNTREEIDRVLRVIDAG